MKKSYGFTLIELLIVVLIIAILAAIAVPNFLEFQTRAKVSRVKSDLRTIATGMEAYMVDWGSYPPDSDESLGNPMTGGQGGLIFLTTPVSFLTSVFMDVFPDLNSSTPDKKVWYELGSGADAGGWPVTNTETVVQAWLLISVGPDRADTTTNNDQFPWGTELWIYDPTNGTISRGDIYRGGGDYMRGAFEINGQETGFTL